MKPARQYACSLADILSSPSVDVITDGITAKNRKRNKITIRFRKRVCSFGTQPFLIMICVAIYAVLINQFALSDDILVGVWKIVGYTLLLVFTLFKTGSLAKSVFDAH